MATGGAERNRSGALPEAARPIRAAYIKGAAFTKDEMISKTSPGAVGVATAAAGTRSEIGTELGGPVRSVRTGRRA